jgi:membrane-associated phospholipid phosphatase
MLLAHYLSDVLAGLAFGAVLDKVVGGLFRVARSAHRRCEVGMGRRDGSMRARQLTPE